MKKILLVIISLVLLLSTAFASENGNQMYSLDDLVQMRMELDKIIAQLQVQKNSALRPAPSFNGEILFRQIPWMSSAIDVRTKLAKDGMIGSSHEIKGEDYIYAWLVSDDVCIESKAGANIAIYDFPPAFTVAGYPLASVQIYCPYSYSSFEIDRTIEHTQFMLATMKFDVSDIELVYADLTNKLSSLYGTPETIVDNNDYWSSTNFTEYNTWNVWYGINNTGAYLYKTFRIEEGSTAIKNAELTLVYGRTDGKEYLDGFIQASENAKKLQDQLLQQENANNVDGL